MDLILINGVQLKEICHSLTLPRATTVAEVLNKICPPYKIIGADFKMFLAQIIHESGEFKNRPENLNYSAKRLAAVWPKRYAENGIPNQMALSLAHNPEKLADTTYANRIGNGNVESGDGYRFRGRGWIQLTGRSNYKHCGLYIGVNLEADPDLLLTDDVACKSACWKYSIDSKLLGVLNMVRVTKKINGGLEGLHQRKTLYEKILKLLPKEK